MLDGGLRSADLRAGPEGAQMLTLERERLVALCEDDTALGTRVLWNISRAMALRARFILWQLQRALQKASQQPISQPAEQPVVAPPMISVTLSPPPKVLHGVSPFEAQKTPRYQTAELIE